MTLPSVPEQTVHFLGHIFPGCALLLLGTFTFIRVCYRFHDLRRARRPFHSTLTFPVQTRFGLLQVEGCLKLIGFVEIFGEILTAVRPNSGDMATETNTQHGTMSAAYALSGIVDLLVHFKVPLPPKADYLAWISALFAEGVLFYFHLDGRDEVNRSFHVLLVFTIFIMILTLILEMIQPQVYIFTFTRSILLIISATWFFQISGSLYTSDEYPYSKPTGAPDGAITAPHGAIMWVVIYYCWHLNCVLVCCLSTFIIISRCFKFKSGSTTPQTTRDQYELLSQPILQTTEVEMDSD